MKRVGVADVTIDQVHHPLLEPRPNIRVELHDGDAVDDRRVALDHLLEERARLARKSEEDNWTRGLVTAFLHERISVPETDGAEERRHRAIDRVTVRDGVRR